MKSFHSMLVPSFLLALALFGCGFKDTDTPSTRLAGESKALETSLFKEDAPSTDSAKVSSLDCSDPELPCPSPTPAGGSGPIDYEPNCSDSRISQRTRGTALQFPYMADRNAKLVVEEVNGNRAQVIHTSDLSAMGPQRDGRLKGMARVKTTINYSNPASQLRFWVCGGSNCPQEGTSGVRGTNVSVRTVQIPASTLSKGIVLPVWNVMDENQRSDPEQCMKQQSPLVIPGPSGKIGTLPLLAGPLFEMLPGKPLRTAWIDSDASFLARDRNGNGRIDDITELYGDYKDKNGFEALAREVSSGAGEVTSKDRIWKELLLWNDKNSDGISQSEELTPISASDITRISLSAIPSEEVDRNGVSTRWKSTFQRADGSYHVIADLYFTVSSSR